MEIITLLAFCTVLVSCIILDISIVFAMLIGFCIFFAYGLIKKCSVSQLIKMIFSSVKKTKNILITFALIGMLTALWRASGTIPTIISGTIQFIHPNTILLIIFLLNCGISMLTGTSFGTAATMGVICMTIAVSMQINPILAGGAILAGAFFGDRCSPVSTSALLVSDLTGTNIFKNIKLMLKTALVPFIISCAIYTIIGMTFKTGAETANLRQLFAAEMNLHFSTLFPALVILLLSLLRVNVKIAMSVSIITAVLVCILIQGNRIIEVFQFMVMGFSAKDAELAKLLNGGGILSMLRVMAIVCISSAYAGIFQVTGLLDPIKKIIIKINNKTTSYCGTLFSAIITSLVACSQTLTIMLTHQLNKDIETNTQKLAIDLEDSAVVVAPLVPWSIAAAVPLASIGAPSSSILAAFFLFLLPAWRLWNKGFDF